MKTNMRILAIIVMMMTVGPAFSEGIWNDGEYSSGGFGARNTSSGETFVNDEDNGYAVGEGPINDGWDVIIIASLLYGVYLVRNKGPLSARIKGLYTLG